MPGIITLYDQADQHISMKTFTSNKHLRKIVDDWRMMYGPKWQTMAYHILPETMLAKRRSVPS